MWLTEGSIRQNKSRVTEEGLLLVRARHRQVIRHSPNGKIANEVILY